MLGRVWTSGGRPDDGHLTKQQARRALDDILAEARRAVPAARLRVSPRPTFADAAAEWLRYVEFDRKRRASTMSDYRHVGEKALVPVFGEVALDSLTSEMIDSYRVHLVAEGRLTARAINKYLVLMNGILRRAQRQWSLTGIEHLRFHDLRHTFGTLAVQEFPLSDVKAFMGHADIATTMLYVHHVRQNDAAARLSARLAGTASSRRVA